MSAMGGKLKLGQQSPGKPCATNKQSKECDSSRATCQQPITPLGNSTEPVDEIFEESVEHHGAAA